MLLDINLPSYDGYYWCRQIRQHSTSPIIFISARSGEMDQVMAIENGGDDYIEKPFSYDIVLAKIKSQIRRAYGEYAAKQGEKVVEYAGVQLFVERFELRFHDEKASFLKKKVSFWKCCWSGEKGDGKRPAHGKNVGHRHFRR